ncbi:MAG: S8/S53 family peptidase [Rhodospirillaceae bacterium]|nr:S8/S53 family peptidase [Rhodospirillaceae bacterium]
MTIVRRLAAAIALSATFASPSVADVEDVLRALTDGQPAEIIVKLKADGPAQSWDRTSSVAEQRALVGGALQDAEAAFNHAGIEVSTTFATLPYVGVTVERSQVLTLLDMPQVTGIYVNAKERKHQVVSGSGATIERATLASSVPSIDVADAWARGFEGKDVTIAVIDGGFFTTHPMLRGKSVQEACFSDHEPEFDTFTRCPSGVPGQVGPGAASNCPAGSTRCDHGTHVASIAVGNDGTNFGVARAAKLLPIEVFSEVRSAKDCDPDPAPCELTDSLTVLKALDHVNQLVTQFNIVAVNLSLGGKSYEGYCDNDPRREVIQMLRAKGVATTISTGNEALNGKINAPSCISSAIAVGASNDATSVASFSNLSSAVDLMAPGVSISAASGQATGLRPMQGTSMAAPHVAGAFAIVRAAMPTKTVDEIEAAFKTTGPKTFRADTNFNVPKAQVNKAILRLEGRDKRVINNVLSSTRAATQGQAFLRFSNDSTQIGNVTVSMRDADTGRLVGTWTSPNIAPRASAQIDINKIESEARAALQATNVIDTARTFFNLEIESTVPGYLQHIVWARNAGVLTNLTACADGLSGDGQLLLNVHSTNIAEYPSRIRIASTGAAPQAATLVFYNSANGKEIGRYTTADIPASGSLEIGIARIETLVPTLKDPLVTGSNAISQYNVRLENFTGYLQHIVENTRTGVLLDLSPKCDLGVRK